MATSPLTRFQVLKLALPVMLAQAAIAATGVVDTAIMGLTGDKSDLAAVAVASVAFSFIYWGFGFLRGGGWGGAGVGLFQGARLGRTGAAAELWHYRLSDRGRAHWRFARHANRYERGECGP